MKVTVSQHIDEHRASPVVSLEMDALPEAGSILWVQDRNDVKRWKVIDHSWLIARIGDEAEYQASATINVVPLDGEEL